MSTVFLLVSACTNTNTKVGQQTWHPTLVKNEQRQRQGLERLSTEFPMAKLETLHQRLFHLNNGIFLHLQPIPKTHTHTTFLLSVFHWVVL